MIDNPPPIVDSNGGESYSLPPIVDSVVRQDSEHTEAQPDNSDFNDGGRKQRSVWKSLSNGVVEPVSVMGGAVSWPTLSETTRPVMSLLSDNTMLVSDGSASSSQDRIIPANDNHHTNSTVNNAMPMRPRRNHVHPPPPLPLPQPLSYFEQTYGMVPIYDTSIRGPRPVGGSQLHTGSDYSQRNNSRRGGYGGRPRGDGSYHNSHGSRRGQVRYPPPYRPPTLGYMPPPMPLGVPPLMPAPPMRGFQGQMRFATASHLHYMMPPPESFRPMGIFTPPSAPLLPHSNENILANKIVKQVDYYFSNDNLAKDHYLRSCMNDQGWVDIHIIAKFRLLKQLTEDIPTILDALRQSTVVEIQGENVRQRNHWKKWLNSSSVINSAYNSKSPTILASSLEQISLDESMINANGNIVASDGHAGVPSGDDTTEKAHQLCVFEVTLIFSDAQNL